MSPMPALLIVNGLVLVAILVLLVRRSGRVSDGAMFQQQLIEMRSRLDTLVTEQREVPRQLAEGRAEQLASVGAQFADLARLVTSQLEATEHTVGDRLADSGLLLAELRERLGKLTESTRRLETLSANVSEVQNLLRVPKLRGTLGEVWLEELLEQVFPTSMFQTQYVFPTGERVDAVLKIGGLLISVDAKFPLEACQRMLANESSDAERDRRTFRRSLKTRIDEIAEKYIRPGDGTYDFALMYVPAERVYHEAVTTEAGLNGDDSVLGYAMSRKVILVSPNSFYAYLAAIIHGLRGLHVEARAREIVAALSALQHEFSRFGRSFEVVGRHLDNAAKQYVESERTIRRIQDGFAGVTGLSASAAEVGVGPPVDSASVNRSAARDG